MVLISINSSLPPPPGMKSVNAQRMYYGVTHPVSLLNVLLDPDNEFDEIEPETDPKKKKRREKLILATVKNKGL